MNISKAEFTMVNLLSKTEIWRKIYLSLKKQKNKKFT